MYNEKIEALIHAALADGVLTEKEKQVLFKKAQSEGIDLDEFEMILDARLYEMQKAVEAEVKASAPKSQKIGDVKTCPTCGKVVQAYLGVCPGCGYSFQGLEANATSKQLAEKLEKLTAEWNEKIAKVTGFNSEALDKKWELTKAKEEALANAIMTTSIPNTKADMFEFLTMSRATFLSPATLYYPAEAYYAKYNEAILKVQALFSQDPMFVTLIADQTNAEMNFKAIHRKQKKAGMKPSVKKRLWIIGSIVGSLLFLEILGILAEVFGF